MTWVGAHGRVSWALLALAALGSPADARTAGAAQGRAAEVLLPAIADRGLALELVRRELAGLGEGSSRELLAIAAERRVVVRVAEREVRLELRPELVDAVLDALAGLPAPSRAGLLEAIVARTDNRGERFTALAMLERVGEGEDLALALRLAGDGSLAQVDPEEALRFEEAAAGCLARAGEDAPPLTHLYVEAHPALAAALLRAIAREPSALALQRLGELLGRRTELDAFALARFAAAAAHLSALQPETVRAPVRSLLASPLPDVVAAAASVAGLLQDPLAAPRLCALLQEHDAQVRGAALGALRRIAGRDLGGDPAAWRAWCGSESAWWESEAPQLLDLATSGPIAEASAAIVAIARRRLHRHEQAEVLAGCLERSEVEVACLAADALGALGSPLALQALERARDAGDVRMREAARRALGRLRAANRARD